MKGSITSETIGIITVVAILVIFFIFLLTKIIPQLLQLISLSSPQNVAIELATIMDSVLSSEEAEVEYIPNKDVSYDVTINNHVVMISMKRGPALQETSVALEKIMLPISHTNSDVNLFRIKKIFAGDVYYEFESEKI